MKNIKEENLISLNNNKINNHPNIEKFSTDITLKNLFIFSDEYSNIIPLLKINCGIELKNIFNICFENINKDSLISIVKNYIKLINEIRKIISNKYEILHIINNFLEKNNIYLFRNYIDLYLLFLFSQNNKNKNASNKSFDDIIKNFQDIFTYFIHCGMLDKQIIDYVFQKIAKMQLEKSISINSVKTFLPLIKILYGKNNYNLKEDYISKNYIYLFNKNTSIIKTNISPSNRIKINNGFCIILWFYLYEYCNIKEKTKGTICQILSEYLQKIDFVINNEYDIEIKYNTRELLKEKKGTKFKIKPNLWTQLKIQFVDNKIKLYLYQKNENNSENKYITKTYLINIENKTNDKSNKYNINKFKNLKCNNFTISYINFFMGYEGLVGTIIFYKDGNRDKNKSKEIISYDSGLKNNNVNDFITKINLNNFYFIIAPSLYINEENKFKDFTHNISAELSIEAKENNLNLNSVLKIYNHSNNISHLGGCNNILPLFEILYKFSQEVKDKEYELKIKDVLKNLFELLEIIFINNEKNCMDAYYNNIYFFESLQLFLENIDGKFFNEEIENKNIIKEKGKKNQSSIISSLINLAKYFFALKNKKILESDDEHGFFKSILFYPSIIMKFNIIQQNIIFSFFDEIKEENEHFKNSDYKTYFIPFDKISDILKLLTKKNADIGIPPKLYNIIKIIFEDFNTTDNERESLFLLYNNHSISDKIFLNIMEIFIIYFDINTNIKEINKFLFKENINEQESKINLRNNSIKYFLYSPNFFIENILSIFLSKNLYIKKLIINFLRILTNRYSSILEEYFSFVNECNKSYVNKRINKNDFFYFIKENIIINDFNDKIIKDFERNKDKKESTKNNTSIKRKDSFENLNRKKLNIITNLYLMPRRKSLSIKFEKNQKKKIILSMTKKKKKKKNNGNISNIKEIINVKKKVSKSFDKKNNKNKDSNLYYKVINDEKEKINDLQENNISIKSNLFSKKKSKSSMTLNVDLINNEYDLIINSFEDKIKKLSVHCVNYILGSENKNDCLNKDIFEYQNDFLKINESENDVIKIRNNSMSGNAKDKHYRNLSDKNSNKLKHVNTINKKKKHRNRKRFLKKQYSNKNVNILNKYEEKEDNDALKLSIEDVKVNCDISMILYDWLVSIPYNKRINESNNKSETIEYINKIINYIVKFLSNTNELEVILRTLFIILGQKSLENNIKGKHIYNPSYSRLLSYFSSSHNFRQLLEEIIIDSYLGFNNDKAIANKYNFNQNYSKLKPKISKKELFEKIYNLSKELLIDIYLYKGNQSKNYIIYELYNIILKKFNGLQKKYNESIFKIFFLLKKFFNEIINKYHDLINSNKHDESKNNIKSDHLNDIINIENKNQLKDLKIYKNFIYFFTLFFEFSFIFKNYTKYLSKKPYKSENNLFLAYPYFLNEGMIFKVNSEVNNIEKWIIYEEYKQIIREIKDIYNLKNIFKELKIPIIETDNQNDVFQFEIEAIQRFVNEIVFKKELRGKYKYNIELLFTSYNQNGYFNNFPLINILSLYKCVFLNYENNNYDKKSIIEVLNDIQSYAISIILISCNIKQDEEFLDKNLNYDEIQEIIYQNLLFILRNIIYKYGKNSEKKNNISNSNEINTDQIINDENKEESSSSSIDENEEEYQNYFVKVLNNIISVLANIYIRDKNLENNSNSILNWKKGKNNDINYTGVNKLIEHYIKIFDSFFNIDNLHYFSNNNNYESNYIIIQQKNNLYLKLVKNANNTNIKEKDKSNSELFHYKIFKSICLGRENEIKKKLKLLLKSNQENNKFKNKIISSNRYKNLLIKIHFLNLYNASNNKLIEKNRYEIFKIKNYRKIKKNLYSFNNSYSNLETFYNKDKKYNLIYKISNYLSKDKTRKLIQPILDIDYYLPNFRKLKTLDGKVFKSNLVDKIYRIDLKILDKKKTIITPEKENKDYYLYNDICLIKTTHHIRGKIFHKTEKEISKNNEFFCFYFTPDNNITKEYLLSNCADYDSLNGTCFGSTFINNNNKKDEEVYVKINFSDINFIFLRKYCFRNNSIEIFLNNNKSYYFKFKSNLERDNFIEKLIYIINNFLTNKKLFKKIKTIDENYKSKILGYYKNIDNNGNYKTINNIKDLWKNSKISSLEYLMWINLYGNRSFRDPAQYPVFPWIIKDYNLNKVENIINLNAIRNFNLPMGMMSFDERSNQRKEDYIEGYKLMVDEISEDFSIKKPSDSIDYNCEEETKNSSLVKTPSDEILKDSEEDNCSNKSKGGSNEKENKLKIPDYRYDLEKLYTNTNIDYEKIPYIFGTHFSNEMYVSHFLVRLFPYPFNMIEIQGNGFDCPDRLFYNLNNIFFSSTHEKSDLRELIPEFFTLPEMFMNLNNLNFGKIEDRYYILNMKKSNKEEEKCDDNIINTKNSSKDDKSLQIDDVALPPWTKQDPYYFTQIMREVFEGGIELNKSQNKHININPWLDLIFGYYQRGIKAQIKGNIFIPASYDGVIDSRIKEEKLLKNRGEYEYLIRFFEIGVHPTKVFEKINKEIKKEINYQITSIKNDNEEFILNKQNSVKLKTKSASVYFEVNYLENNKILILDNNLIGQNIVIHKNNEIDINNPINSTNYLIKEIQIIKDFPTADIKNIGYKLIIKSLFKGLLFVIAGYYDGSIYLIITSKKLIKKSCNISSELNLKENKRLKIYGKKLITSLEISKDEKYMFCGNEEGVLIIYSINYSLLIENKKYIELISIIKSHNNIINSISVNNNLNLFADCAYDGYINIYTFPEVNLINSLYINDIKMQKNEIDYVFLSSQPLPVIALYSNKKCYFKVYSINGHELNYDSNDLPFLKEIEMPLYSNDSMISPKLFTNYKFNDYLAYIFKYKFVIIRKFPEMKCYLKIKCLDNNCFLSKLFFSADLKFLYIHEKMDDDIYIIDNGILIKENNSDNNSSTKKNK